MTKTVKSTPDDYKLRFKNEYKELLDRYTKLHSMLIRYDAKKLNFVPTCSIRLLKKQANIMGRYLYILQVRALIEDVSLDN